MRCSELSSRHKMTVILLLVSRFHSRLVLEKLKRALHEMEGKSYSRGKILKGSMRRDEQRRSTPP